MKNIYSTRYKIVRYAHEHNVSAAARRIILQQEKLFVNGVINTLLMALKVYRINLEHQRIHNLNYVRILKKRSLRLEKTKNILDHTVLLRNTISKPVMVLLLLFLKSPPYKRKKKET